MKHRIRAIILALVLVIALVLGVKFLYRHYVTGQITDLGGMENPDTQINTNQED